VGYTPLKRRTPWATIVGAVPGALPPVIGWTAARGTATAEAWVLFGIVFLWQMPHFHALSWLYRQDFQRAGLPFLAVLDASGRRAAAQGLLCAAALLPMSLAAVPVGLAGPLYLAAAALLGLAFAAAAGCFAARRTPARARALFLASLAYLPLLWGLLVVERAL
jgi:protoheme IX farnesyltransferase